MVIILEVVKRKNNVKLSLILLKKIKEMEGGGGWVKTVNNDGGAQMVVVLTIKKIMYVVLGPFGDLMRLLSYLHWWHEVLWLRCLL